MKILLDSADINEIKWLRNTGILDGVVMTPFRIAQEKVYFTKLIGQISDIIDGPVICYVMSKKMDDMIDEAQELAKLGKNICVSLPANEDGFKACQVLTRQKIAVNITLCFSTSQAFMAAKCGAMFVSLFVGRLDELSSDGLSLISETRSIYDNYTNFGTQIIVSATRNAIHVVESAKLGADIVSVPSRIVKQMIHHPMTELGISKMHKDLKEEIKD